MGRGEGGHGEATATRAGSWQVAPIDFTLFPPGAPITDVVWQTPSILVALTVGSDGRITAIRLDTSIHPYQWAVAGFGPATFVPGTRITDLVWQTPTILTGLVVDGQGFVNVVWLDLDQQPHTWQVAAFGPAVFSPVGRITALVRQTSRVLAALAVDVNGYANVLWLDVESPQWRVSPFGLPVFPAGAYVTDPVWQTPTILAALAVDIGGRGSVIWLDLAQAQGWRIHPFEQGTFVAGGPIGGLGWQASGVLAALAIDASGSPAVLGLDVRQAHGWDAATFAAPTFPAGAPVTELAQQTSKVVAALAVDAGGRANVAWTDSGQQPQQWRAAAFGPASFVPGTRVSDVVWQSSEILAALAIDAQGLANVLWLDLNQQSQQWQVATFGAAVFPSSAAITRPTWHSPTRLASLAIDASGRVNVLWLDLSP
ncbi:hypothetical protein [Nannocystis radixulma]|uniref:Uncharacterized protein n=1 Tax=Nannocystis radixulma TaxID=2995305 RepID=A0ABT5BEU8_9BACT|nr:hypothetical protein [Nannocystis radixulma]MDC0672664.1 hypothetical protein [Nannocystis radixulma]